MPTTSAVAEAVKKCFGKDNVTPSTFLRDLFPGATSIIILELELGKNLSSKEVNNLWENGTFSDLEKSLNGN